MLPSAPQVAVVHHGDAQDAKEAFLNQFKVAFDSGRWLAVAVTVAPDGTLTVHRTTYGFPVDQFDAALDLLRRDLERDRGGNRPTPLPVRRVPLSPRVVTQEQPQERHNGDAPDLLPDAVTPPALEQENNGDLVL